MMFPRRFTSSNYIDPSADPYAYYVRRHNPPILYNSVSSVPARTARVRNFNDFAVDLNASTLPQWLFVTPNIVSIACNVRAFWTYLSSRMQVNDGHDTTIDFAADWLTYWLDPLLSDTRFNDGRTLILVTFDETENYLINNNVFAVLLGGAVPASLHGTTDSTYYTHYSAMSSVQANWGLGSLGRGDTDPYLPVRSPHPFD
jgi:hypothetical protein